MLSFAQFVNENIDDGKTSTEVQTREFEVPSHNVEYLEKKIEKLNKTAAKLGCSPITLTKSSPYSKKIKNGEYRKDGTYQDPTFMEHIKVSVNGEAPKLKGWTFVGKREPMEGSDSIMAKSAPGSDLPKEYSDDHGLKCDHCQKRARRNETFVVKNDEGKHMEVGRSCLKDFLGHANPEKYADFAAALYDVESVFSELANPDYEGGYGRAVMTFATRSVVAAAIHSIKQRGFVSRQYESEGKTATSTAVNLHMNPPKKDPQDFIMPVTKQDYDDADKAIEWMKAHPKADKEEFWTNISKISSGEHMPLRYSGYVSAGANTYLKELGAVKDKEGMMKTVKNEGLGQEGDKVSVKGTVVSSFSYQNAWGTKHIITVKADSGHLIKMFTSSGDEGVKKDARVEITGKVGKVEPETYDRSPFKGTIMTTMAPRSRIESVLDAETADKHFHVGDKIRFTGSDGKGKIGQIISKPVFGKFEVKSITKLDAPAIHVSFEDIIGLM
jgi:hypothetical protein